jgi:succinate dehydrogenase/fumarate reductase flavoprotein subunit
MQPESPASDNQPLSIGPHETAPGNDAQGSFLAKRGRWDTAFLEGAIVIAGTAADVIVVGAGAAGLAAALTAAVTGARVLVLEAASQVGGSLSVSGGIVWVPGNRQMLAAGHTDSRDAALAYFRSLDPAGTEPAVLEAFVDHGAEAIGFLEDHSSLQFALLEGYPDYYLERPGAKPEGGRALDSGLFAYAELGDWRDKVATNGAPYPLTLAETPLGGGTGMIAPEVMADRLARDVRGFGQALLGHLLQACLARGVEIAVEHPVTELMVDQGRVVGVIANTPMGEDEFAAERGVIITTGGFEWNRPLVQTFLRGPMTMPASPPTNQGSGLTLLMKAGAALGNMTSSWWCPVIQPTGETWFGGAPRAYPVLIERTMPGSLMVNRRGERFVNEAVNYSALAGAFHAFDPATYDYANLPCWLVFDEAYRARVPVASAMPGQPKPDWIVSADTIEGLAQRLGLPGAALATTVARFNALAEAGSDSDFGRGQSPYDRFYGDRSQPGARATLGALTTPPFHAVELQSGTLGTNGGARTDAVGRILDHAGAVIPGLYGAGNVIACPTGSVYAGAGGTLGPALTFGYLAGQHAARGGN